MNNVKMAKKLLKLADELFDVQEYQETEHDKIDKILKQYGKSYKGDFVILEVKFADTLFEKLNYQNLKADNFDKIIIHLNLRQDIDYSINDIINSLKDANKQALIIQEIIKKQFNKTIEIKLNYN